MVDRQLRLQAKCLPVAGAKDDSVSRSMDEGDVLPEKRAKDIERLHVEATSRGPLPAASPSDLMSEVAARQWIETVRGECRDQPKDLT